MVNVASLILFFSFSSNVTGHYAILAEELSNGRWFQVVVVFFWIFLFLFGSFFSNIIVIHSRNQNQYVTHAIPLCIEIICLLTVGIYGAEMYEETLIETEFMVAILLFAMGVQNGLTASISNFSVKTTHLTGLTTDLGIHLSMMTRAKYRKDMAVIRKLRLMLAIAVSYLAGGLFSGLLTNYFQFKVFFLICMIISIVLLYDFVKIFSTSRKKQPRIAEKGLTSGA